MTKSKLTWNGPAIVQALIDASLAGLDEVGLRVEGAAKENLYEGHGKRTGRLQRSIAARPAAVVGRKGRVRIATRGVRYAKKIEQRYRFMLSGYVSVRPQIKNIIARRMREVIDATR